MGKFLEKGRVISNEQLSKDMWQIELRAPKIAGASVPGQFLMVGLSGYLRRPFGVADVNGDCLKMIYRIVGSGTHHMMKLKPGAVLDVEGPLGVGFAAGRGSDECSRHILVGGGAGLAPLLLLAHDLYDRHVPAEVIIGAKNEQEASFWKKLFNPYIETIHVTTDDGSAGVKGFPTDVLPKLLNEGHDTSVECCGPGIMMKGIAGIASACGARCEVSLESRMACGFGVCLGCSFTGADGRRHRVCKDGPVFPSEVVW